MIIQNEVIAYLSVMGIYSTIIILNFIYSPIYFYRASWL